MLLIMLKLSMLVYNIVGKGGLPILVMPLDIVPNILCQHIFVLSDPCVPRTSVVDCRYATYTCAIYSE